MSMTQKEHDEFCISLFTEERDDTRKVIEALAARPYDGATALMVDTEIAEKASELLERLIEFLENDLEKLTQKS